MRDDPPVRKTRNFRTTSNCRKTRQMTLRPVTMKFIEVTLPHSPPPSPPFNLNATCIIPYIPLPPPQLLLTSIQPPINPGDGQGSGSVAGSIVGVGVGVGRVTCMQITLLEALNLSHNRIGPKGAGTRLRCQHILLPTLSPTVLTHPITYRINISCQYTLSTYPLNALSLPPPSPSTLSTTPSLTPLLHLSNHSTCGRFTTKLHVPSHPRHVLQPFG